MSPWPRGKALGCNPRYTGSNPVGLLTRESTHTSYKGVPGGKLLKGEITPPPFALLSWPVSRLVRQEPFKLTGLGSTPRQATGRGQ